MSTWASRAVRVVAIALVGLAVSSPAAAAPDDTLLVLVDTSGSMSGEPLRAAQDALGDVLAGPDDGVATGLRTFAGDCSAGTQLLVPLATDNSSQLLGAVDGLVADGATPMTPGLLAAAADVAPLGGGTILLLSDGQDDCGDVPICEVVERLAATGDLVVNTVAYGDAADQAALQCIAQVTGGTYREADQASLDDVLPDVVDAGGGGPGPLVGGVVVVGALTAVTWTVARRPGSRATQRRLVAQTVQVRAVGDRSPDHVPPADVDGGTSLGIRLRPHGAQWTHQTLEETHER